jgi:hypothetical protein
MDAAPIDSRSIPTGYRIPAEAYCDQPYVVKTEKGVWLCVLTTGRGHEGQAGQHVVAIRSTDRGRTWSEPVSIEPPSLQVSPESSWAMPLRTPSGRVYAFYVHNSDNRREVISDHGPVKRVDTLGHYVFRYSDDGGRTWSSRRYPIPMRRFRIDRENPYGGDVLFFWGVGKPIEHDGAVLISMSKVGRFGDGFLARSEGFFLRSDNLLTETDPERIRWETLPEGDEGLKAPEGPIAEEQNLVFLSDGSLYCTYRTVQGHPCHAYSRDGGRAWTPPEYMTYSPGGRRIKHPRAANFVRRFSNGRYLYWFHNHGGRTYADRNPAWLSGGVERAGKIHWSQPEIVLYDDDPTVRISYPDFIEDDGRVFITETQKSVARVHEVDPKLLDGLWRQAELRAVAREGVILSLEEAALKERVVAVPRLPDLSARGGFTVEFWVRFDALTPNQILLDTRDARGSGLAVTTTDQRTLRLHLGDGTTTSVGECDPGILRAGRWHHVAMIVDGGPRIITFVVDGELCDGGDARTQGWHRFSPDLAHGNGRETMKIAPALHGELKRLRLYGRYLRTSEAVGNYRAGLADR